MREAEKRKKVLIVHNYYQIPGGEDTVVANEKKLLEEHGHEVLFYSRNNSELKKFSAFQKMLLPFSTIFNIRTYREVKRMIRENGVEIVHVHNTLNLVSPSVYYAAFASGVPVVQTVHNFRLLCPGAVFLRDGHICEDCVRKGLSCAVKYACYRGSRAQTLLCVWSTKLHRMIGTYRKLNYICLTEFNRQKLLLLNRPGEKIIIDPGRIFVKPNFVFEPEKLPVSGKKDFYLFIGRIEELKGIGILLDAFEKLPDKKLFLAGGGPELARYRRLAEERNIKNVVFLGFLDREALTERLAGAKAVIAASQCYESFGMMIAEAYAAHVPVIAGDIGNLGVLVEDGKTGLKFRYDSSEALAETIERFEELETEEWGENAYEKFRKEFSAEMNYTFLNEIYNCGEIL